MPQREALRGSIALPCPPDPLLLSLLTPECKAQKLYFSSSEQVKGIRALFPMLAVTPENQEKKRPNPVKAGCILGCTWEWLASCLSLNWYFREYSLLTLGSPFYSKDKVLSGASWLSYIVRKMQRKGRNRVRI